MAVAFQLGIGSTSPTITYHPFSPNVIAQDATSGWTTYFTNSGFPSTPGQAGDGTGLQISSENGSFFSITWFGIGIDLYGNATLAAFEVSLDRKNGGSGSGDVMVGPSSNLLASFSNLPLDTYTVTLTANTSSSPSSFIAFERAVITSAVEVANLNDLTVQSVTVDNAMIVYEGLWSTFQSTVIAPESQFHVTDQLGDTAQLTFNGTAVSVFGLRDTIAVHMGRRRCVVLHHWT
ncbi:hypothetical protein BJ322DRAFT_60191 [Thelephora terrestris]|uniref:Uncharacterized protein n=1 Tax=Thelephora terrestris TaxID=56493 RepID=A0A9P6LBP4_9AGAM|nr:hypothetical protein BJ322DRAFT_60191 [Thelephora terrestris]